MAAFTNGSPHAPPPCRAPQIELKRPDLPCVMVGRAANPGAVLVPMELCAFVSCQPAPVTPDVQQEMIKLSQDETPAKRFEKIRNIHDDLRRDTEQRDPAKTLHGFDTTLGTTLGTALRILGSRRVRPGGADSATGLERRDEPVQLH